MKRGHQLLFQLKISIKSVVSILLTVIRRTRVWMLTDGLHVGYSEQKVTHFHPIDECHMSS